MKLLSILAQNIKTRRQELNISQEKLAEITGLHRTYIGAVERQERNISINNIEKIADALSMPAYALLMKRD